MDEIVSFVVGIQRDQREAEAIFGKRFFEVGPVVANAEPNSLMLSRRDLCVCWTRTRLRRLVRRLIDGEAIRVGYLGGSGKKRQAYRIKADICSDRGRWSGTNCDLPLLWPAQTLELLARTFPSEDHRLQGV